MKRSAPRRRALFLAVIVGAAGMSLFTVTQAAAQTGGGPAQQAAQLASQINANATKLDAVNEQINGAQVQLQQANATIADDQTRIDASKAQADQLQKLVEQRAASVYQGSSNGSSTSLFNIDPSELASSQKYTQAASDQDNTLIDQLNADRAELNIREKEALSAKQQAEKAVADLQAAQASLRATTAQYQGLQNQVQGQLVTLVAQAQAQQTARQAPPSNSGGGGGGGANFGNIPAVGGGAGQAVAFAEAQVGKGYCYAGTGPSCFDCSGLTMTAWGSAGVGMSHFSGAQYDEFPHIPMSALQPGDLVFTADPGQHVGIYVGGGTVVHASNPNGHPGVTTIGVDYFSLAARP